MYTKERRYKGGYLHFVFKRPICSVVGGGCPKHKNEVCFNKFNFQDGDFVRV